MSGAMYGQLQRVVVWAAAFLCVPAPGAAQEETLARGRHIVHHVAMCVQCHTPRDENGQLIQSQWLQGARLPVRQPYPQWEWAHRAPKIAGLPGWTFEEGVRFLQTGVRANGRAPRAPMPPFRMTKEDAEAVVTYLKSLEPE